MIDNMHVCVLCLSIYFCFVSSVPIQNNDLTLEPRIDEQKQQLIQNKIKRSQSIVGDLLTSLGKNFAPQDPEMAKFESDSQSKKMFSAVQSFLINVLKPQPIVDTITEEEKYGNDGEKFARVGRTLVGGAETLTNFFASVVDVPMNVLKGFTRKASTVLSGIGTKLVGL
ncbi:uncharacterized protein LOC126176692 [Schistocerca cancellata]|uniref:uncharacterized protein LOC126176692 n=1 Tax=Schistocerca cancellata TaxID=274614 RepID=UPI002117474D|nr:uncharacterized protein LOC126176692 [Schistocerca cancellata]